MGEESRKNRTRTSFFTITPSLMSPAWKQIACRVRLYMSPLRSNLVYLAMITCHTLKQRDVSLWKDNSKLLRGAFSKKQPADPQMELHWSAKLSPTGALKKDDAVISLGQDLRLWTKAGKMIAFCVVNLNVLTNVVGQPLWVKQSAIHQLLTTV